MKPNRPGILIDNPRVLPFRPTGATVNTVAVSRKIALSKSQAQFVDWVKTHYPLLFQKAAPALTGSAVTATEPFVAEGSLSGLEDFTAAVEKLASSYAKTRGAVEQIKANSKRAKQNLPPAPDVTQAAPPSAFDQAATFFRDNQALIVLPLVAFLGYRALKGRRR